jgi:hypothetical protein
MGLFSRFCARAAAGRPSRVKEGRLTLHSAKKGLKNQSHAARNAGLAGFRAVD